MKFEINAIVEGKVTKITPFGAFVELEKGRLGLIHISQIADTYVNNVADFLCVDDRVQVKIISLDQNGKKIGLSMKQASGVPLPSPPDVHEVNEEGCESFEDRLARFMKYSNNKQLTLKKHQDNKKGR